MKARREDCIEATEMILSGMESEPGDSQAENKADQHLGRGRQTVQSHPGEAFRARGLLKARLTETDLSAEVQEQVWAQPHRDPPSILTLLSSTGSWDFPGGAGDTGWIPGPGRFHVPWSNGAHGPQLPSLCSGAQEPQLLGLCAPTADT